LSCLYPAAYGQAVGFAAKLSTMNHLPEFEIDSRCEQFASQLAPRIPSIEASLEKATKLLDWGVKTTCVKAV